MPDEVLVVRPKAVGRRIRLIRKFGLGMSGREFAREILGVEDSSLTSKIERGDVTPRRMKAIASRSPGRAAMRNLSEAEVQSFLEGVIDELPLVLAADLQVIEGGRKEEVAQGRSRSSPGASLQIDYFGNTIPDQRERIA